MSVKDPRINMCVLSGKVSKEYEERAGGDYINGKVSIEIFNLSYDKETKKKEYKPITMEVKVLGRSDAKPGSALYIMRGLNVGDRVVVTGCFEADFFQYQGKECSKTFIQASRVQTIEAEDKPAPKTKGDPEPDAPTTEDDIPF